MSPVSRQCGREEAGGGPAGAGGEGSDANVYMYECLGNVRFTVCI